MNSAWRSTPLKRVCALNLRTLGEDTAPDWEMQYLDISAVNSDGTTSPPEIITFARAPSRARRVIRAGDVVVSTVRTYLKAIAHFPSPPNNLVASTGFAVLTPLGETSPDFLWRRVQEHSFVDSVVANSEGVGYPAIAPSRLGSLKVSLPCLDEQARIATYLDAETNKIDRLVALRRRQIELLREQRAALIQQAVTRGLDPTVTLKDSGLPWLGQVPAHWQAKRLKYACPQVTVGIVVNPSHHYVDAGIPCLRSLNVNPGELSSDDLVFINDDSHRLLGKSAVFEGDIVAVRTGQPGTAAVVDHRYDNANCIDLIIIRKSPCFDSEYMQMLLNSRFASAQFEADSDGAIQQHFNIGTAKNLQVLLPPLPEQVAIRAYVERSCSRINQLIEMYERQCTLMAEFRSALIHECVTGLRAVPEA